MLPDSEGGDRGAFGKTATHQAMDTFASLGYTRLSARSIASAPSGPASAPSVDLTVENGGESEKAGEEDAVEIKSDNGWKGADDGVPPCRDTETVSQAKRELLSTHTGTRRDRMTGMTRKRGSTG